MERVPELARNSVPSRTGASPRRSPARSRGAVTPAVALELQQLVGNAEATRLLTRRPAASRRLQRLMSSDDLQAFALDYHGLLVELKALKKPTLITKHKKALDKLKARADTAGLATSHPGMYAVLEGLDDCANGTRPATDVPGLVARDPAAIGHVGSIAAATFTPRTGGNGTYDDADMRALLDHERQRHPKVKEEPVLRMNIAITAVEQAYRRHRQAVQNVTTPGENLMVFLGAEWFFGVGRPYSPKEYEDAEKRIVAVSALYPDVIFIPGTILTYTKKKDDRYLGVRNLAPVAWHGNLITTVQKQLHGGDLDPKEFIAGSGDPTFTLGDLKLALDICQDHEQKRAQGVTNDADVHLVTSAGNSPTVEKSAVKPLGLMIGADVAGSGAGFVQNDPAAADTKKGQNVAAETLAFGDAKGAKHQVRLLDYMTPKARGVQVAPGDRFTPDQAGNKGLKPAVPRKVQIVDSTGALIDITL